MTNSDQAPASPLTALAQYAVSLHELYRAYVDAGFTKPQALQLVIAVLREGIAGGRQ